MTTASESLKKLVLRGSAWTMIGIGSAQFIRLSKSLFLSRLLFPDAYGVMAIVWAVLYGLDMLSDVGISPGIIRSSRGDDPAFLNTAWTMKVIRGGALFLVSCLIAYPASLFYHLPILAFLIPVAGFTALIEGFGTTNIYTCQRNLRYERITLLEFLTDIVGVVVTLTWAYFHPTVWALVGGAIIGRIFHVAAGHAILPGIRNTFKWDKSAFKELLTFGKWIFFSSAVYLLYAQGDRILLGKYVPVSLLGIYSVAMILCEAVEGVVKKLNDSVVFPALSRVANTERHRLQEVFYKTRLGTDALMVTPIAILMVIGDDLVKILYDARYQSAGWILQILCVRLLMTALLVSSASCLVAIGHSRYFFAQNLCRAIWILIGIPSVWPLYGINGVVWVVALTEIPALIVLWQGRIKHGVFSKILELRSVLFILLGLIIGYGIRYVAHLFMN